MERPLDASRSESRWASIVYPREQLGTVEIHAHPERGDSDEIVFRSDGQLTALCIEVYPALDVLPEARAREYPPLYPGQEAADRRAGVPHRSGPRPLEASRTEAQSASARPENGALDTIYGGSVSVQPDPERPYLDQIRFESYDGKVVLIEVWPVRAEGRAARISTVFA